MKKVIFGLSVGTNGVSVYAHSASFFPCLLAHRRPISTWTHIAVVVTGSRPSLYINGELAQVGLKSDRKLYLYASSVGASGSNSSPYTGDLDEMRFYSKSLSAEEVKLIYDAERDRNRCFRMEARSPLGYFWTLDGTVQAASNDTFRTVTGLAGSNTVSFVSCDQEGLYFRHA